MTKYHGFSLIKNMQAREPTDHSNHGDRPYSGHRPRIGNGSADYICPHLLDFDYDEFNLVDKLGRETPTVEVFKHYLKTIRSIAQKMKLSEYDEYMRAVADLPPCDLTDLPHIPDEFAQTLL